MELNVLRDKIQDTALRELGYVVTPFLEEDEILSLGKVCQESNPAQGRGFFASAHGDNAGLKRHINEQIIRQFRRAVNACFYSCSVLGGTFVIKYAEGDSRVSPHQDWSITDEEQFRSYNLWVPLVDTNSYNGTLSVVPYSHTFVKSYRGLNIADPFVDIASELEPYLLPLELKAGSVVIYDTALIHASGNNLSAKPRVAILASAIPDAAEMKYYCNGNGVIEEYESNLDFFCKEEILKGPANLRKLRDINYLPPKIGIEEFRRMYSNKNAP